jgi:hypothetical protein
MNIVNIRACGSLPNHIKFARAFGYGGIFVIAISRAQSSEFTQGRTIAGEFLITDLTIGFKN